MALKLMYITNDEKIAAIAESNGVEWVFVDLEIKGKQERQGHLDTVISVHSHEDVKKIKSRLNHAGLLVRINPIDDDSETEINRVISDGADIVMLPFFKTADEVRRFLDCVAGRAETCLLLETPEAVEIIDSLLELDGIDYIHIGLNDLHLGYGMDFLFEPLADGTVEMLCEKIRAKGIPYGFGGIAAIGRGELPAEKIMAEHYRLGSSMVILSRSFCNLNVLEDFGAAGKIFSEGIKEIRNYETQLKTKDRKFFEDNRKEVVNLVSEIKKRKKNAK